MKTKRLCTELKDLRLKKLQILAAVNTKRLNTVLIDVKFNMILYNIFDVLNKELLLSSNVTNSDIRVLAQPWLG